MAKSKENPNRQMLIHLNGTSQMTDQDVNKLALGEIAVNHGVKPELYTVYTDSANTEHIARFVDEVAVDQKIADLHMENYALSATVDGYMTAVAEDFNTLSGSVITLEGNVSELSGSVVSDYALSSVTHTEIETAKETVIGQAGDSASADTIYGSKAYTDARIDEVVAGSVTGVTGANYIEAAVVDHNIHVSADTQAMATADADNKGLAEASDVKAYVDAAKDAAISSAASYTDTEINTLSSATHTEIETAKGWASGYTNQEINTLSSNTHSEIATAKQEAIDTASGYTDTQISNLKGDATASGDTLGKLEDRIEEIEAGGVQSVTKAEDGDGDYISITVDNTNPQRPVLSVEDTVVAMADADSNQGLAEASDVKAYVDEAEADAVAAASAYTKTVSGNIETALEAVSATVVSDYITKTDAATVSGNVITSANGYTDAEITELIGDMTGETKTLGALESRIDNLTTDSEVTIIDSATTGGYLKSYTFMQGGNPIGVIDIPKDLVVTSGEIVENPEGQPEGKYLKLTIANQAEPVYINVADLADVYTAGNGITISNTNEVAAKVVEANGLSVDGDGIKMAVASSAQTGAMSAADKAKLDGIEADADVNVLEGVQVNGSDLTVDGNKKVNVTVAEGATDGTIAVNGADVAVHGLKSAAFETVENLNNTASGYAVSAKEEAIDAVVGESTDDSGDTTIHGVQKYVDEKVKQVVDNAVTGATGDESLINANVVDHIAQVSATQDLINAVAKANSALQSIAATGDNYVSATADSTSSITVTTTVANLTGTTDGLVDAADARQYIANAVSAESVTRETADQALSDRIEDEVSARTAADTALGDRIDGEASARTAADQALSDRIDAIASDSVLSVNSGTNGTYVTLTVDNTDAQNPVISVSDDIQAVASADASNQGLAEASDVKSYVDGEINTLSANAHTEIVTLSGNVIGNAESTSADTTILGVKAYVDEMVAEKNVDASGDTYVSATASANTVFVEASQAVKDAADGAVLSVATGNTANVTISNHEIDFNNMVIDCGTY